MYFFSAVCRATIYIARIELSATMAEAQTRNCQPVMGFGVNMSTAKLPNYRNYSSHKALVV